MKRAFALTLILAACLAAPAAAQMPPLLSYQGILADASGVAVPDNTYSITFKIYNVGSGGSALWTETNNVEVSKGTFSALLGATSMLNILPFNETYYIGLSIEGGPELPRQVLTGTPYSFSAKSVSGTGNVIPSSGNAGIGTTAPDVPLTVTSESGQVGIRFDGNDDAWTSIYVNALKSSSSSGYGYSRLGVLQAHMYLDNLNNWHLRMGGPAYAIHASPTGNVSIGALYPSTQRLTVDGALQLGNSNGSSTGTIRWTGSDFEGYDGSTWQSFTSTGEGPPPGSAGQTLRYNGSGWIGTSNLYNDGTNIGIGTTTPSSALHIQTGDIHPITIDGLAAGAWSLMRINAAGSNSSPGIELCKENSLKSMLYVGSDDDLHVMVNGHDGLVIDASRNVGLGIAAPEARLHVNGDARIGSSFDIGYLGLFRPGIPTAVVSLTGLASGGEVTTYDEDYNSTCTFRPSFGGEGGMLGVTRNTDQWGLYFDGSYSAGQPALYLMGESQSAIFDLGQSGNGSVWLPYESVSSWEMADEPGVASYANETGVTLGMSVSTIASQSITTPGAGYILVIASSNVSISHTNGAASHAIIGTSNSASSYPVNQDMYVDYPATAATGIYFIPATCHGLYYNPYGGTYTYYMLGVLTGGAYTCYGNQLSLVYIPTAYGSVQPTFASVSGTGAKNAGAALTAADVAAQKTASEAANAERIRKELDELRAEVNTMKAKLETRAPAKPESK